MYSFMLHDMAKKIVEDADLKGTFDYDRVLMALQDYWKDKIADVWGVDDVQEECPALTKTEARYVLDSVLTCLDSECGITWDTIRRAIERKYPQKLYDIDEDADYELFYDSGGHCGPIHGFAEAKETAQQLLRSSSTETIIHIVPRDGAYFGIEGSVFEVRRTHACTA